MDVDLLQVGLVHVGVGLDRLDEVGHAIGRLAQVVAERAGAERRRDPADRDREHAAGGLGDAVEPGLVQPGRRERLGELPRVGDVVRLQPLADRVLRVGRRQPFARPAPSEARSSASRLSRTNCSASMRSMPASTNAAIEPSSTSSASASAAALRFAADAGLLSSCASPADICPSAASFSRCNVAPSIRARTGRNTRMTRLNAVRRLEQEAPERLAARSARRGCALPRAASPAPRRRRSPGSRRPRSARRGGSPAARGRR